MRVKEKLIRQKQSATQRPNVKHADSTPLLMRLQRQYMFNKNNNQQPSVSQRQQINTKNHNKQNRINLINSVPGKFSQYGGNNSSNNNIIKIDNYEGKRFKTQAGYVPQMTKSRYEAPSDLSSMEDHNMYSSQQRIDLRKDKGNYSKGVRYESMQFHKNQFDRPLTFGLIKKGDPLKSSVEYNEDRKMKNEALTQISQLRKSQETLLGSKQYSSDAPRCANHLNKKAKYRLITDYQQKQYEEDMIYCSKCAINLLQQNFKVQQLKPQHHISITDSHTNQTKYTTRNNNSRLQQIRRFEQKVHQVEQRLNKKVQQTSEFQIQIGNIDKDIVQTESVYDYLLDVLQQMKGLDLQLLSSIKQKKSQIYENMDKQLINQLQSLNTIKKQIKQCRNKYIIMKQSQYKYTIQQFIKIMDKFGNYDKFYQNTEQLDYRRCEINQKVDRIIQSLWGYGKQIEKQSQNKSQLTSALKHQQYDQNKNQESGFICEEIQRPPFRTLFPDSDFEECSQHKIKDYDSSQSPSFKK